MARKPRRISSMGIYHIILKGTNAQEIFEEDSDYRYFLKCLAQYREKYEYTIFAYCIMGNHIHLLMKVGKEEMEVVFKSIEGKFVYWYNAKYGRHGSLFQDRYRSEPVENERYFLTALRYILWNPVKAGLASDIWRFAWSSAKAYQNQSDGITDIQKAILIAGSEAHLYQFLNRQADDSCLEIQPSRYRVTDEQGLSIMRAYTPCKNTTDFQKLGKEDRDKYLRILYRQGLSQRQLERLCGVSRRIVRKAIAP